MLQLPSKTARAAPPRKGRQAKLNGSQAPEIKPGNVAHAEAFRHLEADISGLARMGQIAALMTDPTVTKKDEGLLIIAMEILEEKVTAFHDSYQKAFADQKPKPGAEDGYTAETIAKYAAAFFNLEDGIGDLSLMATIAMDCFDHENPDAFPFAVRHLNGMLQAFRASYYSKFDDRKGAGK